MLEFGFRNEQRIKTKRVNKGKGEQECRYRILPLLLDKQPIRVNAPIHMKTDEKTKFTFKD
jgi:hypothetical protein